MVHLPIILSVFRTIQKISLMQLEEILILLRTDHILINTGLRSIIVHRNEDMRSAGF